MLAIERSQETAMENATRFDLKGHYRFTRTGRMGAYCFVVAPIVAAIATAVLFAPSARGGGALLAGILALLAWSAFLVGAVLILVGRTIEIEARQTHEQEGAKRLWSDRK